MYPGIETTYYTIKKYFTDPLCCRKELGLGLVSKVL